MSLDDVEHHSDSAHAVPIRREREPGGKSFRIESKRHVPAVAKTWPGVTHLTYEQRIQLLALAAGLPGSAIALILLWTGDYSSRTVWTLAFIIVGFWLGFAFSLRHRVVFSLQTLSNLLAALREEDFSVRGRDARRDDAMGEVMIEVNALEETLRSSDWARWKLRRCCAR